MNTIRFVVALMVLSLARVDPVASDESRLITTLQQNYVSTARPVLASSTAVQVAIDISLAQIIRVDPKNQLFVTNVWVRLYWKDEKLQWNATEYGDTSAIRILSSQVWTPDIVLYNRIEGDESSDIPDTNAIITSDGDVTWLYPVTMVTSCRMDVYRFPYDEHQCNLQFGSWTYDGLKVNVTHRNENGDSSSFVYNEQWDLLGFTVTRNEVLYACCPEPYPDVTFTVSIRRKSLYYQFYVIAPCALMAVMGLFVFCMPPDCGEKLSVGITMLLALVVFMQLIAEILPATSRYIPRIGQFFGCTVCVVAVSSAATILVLNLHFRGPKPTPLPEWLRTFVRKLKILRRESNVRRVQALQTKQQSDFDAKKGCDVITDRPKTSFGFTEVHLDDRDTRSSELSRAYSMMQRKLDEQGAMLKRLVDKVVEKEREELVRDEWQNAADVIDKVLLGVFLLVLTLAAIIAYA